MQVYKMFFKIAKKHATQCFIFLGIFIVIIIMLSYSAKENNSNTFEAKKVDITIIDEDNSQISKGIVEYLDTRHNIVEFENNSKENITDRLFYQYISYALTIPEGFEESFLAGNESIKTKYSMRKDNELGYFLNMQVEAYLDTVNLYLAGGYGLEEAIDFTSSSLSNASVIDQIGLNKTASDGSDTMFYYFQYMSYVVVMMFAGSLAPIIMVFQKKEISERLACSATSSKARNTQIGFACLTYSVTVWVIFIIIAWILYGTDAILCSNGIMCIINSFVFTLIATSITLLLSSFHLDDNALNMVANICSLGMSFICGVFVPQWLLGESVQTIGRFLPTYWYMKIVNMVSGWSGEELLMESFWKYIGIQVVFVVAIFSMYLVVNSQRVKKF